MHHGTIRVILKEILHTWSTLCLSCTFVFQTYTRIETLLQPRTKLDVIQKLRSLMHCYIRVYTIQENVHRHISMKPKRELCHPNKTVSTYSPPGNSYWVDAGIIFELKLHIALKYWKLLQFSFECTRFQKLHRNYWFKNASQIWSKFASHYAWGTDGVMTASWMQSLHAFLKTTSWR